MGQRSYPDKARVYLDMDGVIADFDAACASCAMTPSQFKRLPGAYRTLLPSEGACNAVAFLETEGIEMFVVTKIPPSNPCAATEKLLWIRDHFPQFVDRVIITPDKGCIGERRDVLIDDHPEWANVDHFRGTVVRFTGNWRSTLVAVFGALQKPMPPPGSKSLC